MPGLPGFTQFIVPLLLGNRVLISICVIIIIILLVVVLVVVFLIIVIVDVIITSTHNVQMCMVSGHMDEDHPCGLCQSKRLCAVPQNIQKYSIFYVVSFSAFLHIFCFQLY